MTALLPLSSSVVSSLSGFLFMGFCSLQLRRSIGHIISPRKFKTVPCLFVTDYSYPGYSVSVLTYESKTGRIGQLRTEFTSCGSGRVVVGSIPLLEIRSQAEACNVICRMI